MVSCSCKLKYNREIYLKLILTNLKNNTRISSDIRP